MKLSLSFKVAALSCILALPLLLQVPVAKAGDWDDEKERAEKAAIVLQEIMEAPDAGIPKDLLEKATAVAVIPSTIKGSFIVGGSQGKGVVSQRGPNGKWSAPAFIEISGGSYGIQLGVSSTDYVLVFTNREGAVSMLEGKTELGAGAGVAAGPVGRTTGAKTGIQMESKVFTYSRSKGAFAGVSLEGAYLRLDDGANRDVYGREIKAKELPMLDNMKPKYEGTPFVDALTKYAS
jgi:lipid-binding SYLF domain-containing protein